MKVVHCECGLGNQMLDYCELLAVKKMNPDDECYIETILFEVPECQETISAWNGFELSDIFGVKVSDISTHFNNDQWTRIIENVRESHFWLDGWSYPDAVSKAFAEEGLLLDVRCKSRYFDNSFKQAFNFMKKTRLWSELLIRKTDAQYKPIPDQLFFSTQRDVYCGHTLQFMNVGNDIEKIEKEIRETFVFPAVDDAKNSNAIKEIQSCNSVGIHIRRDDAVYGVNRSIFYTGYYKKAVALIKSKISNPVFYIFGTPKTMRWVKENLPAIGLDLSRDNIRYVDWNSGKNSYRDMQLLSTCKHSIISQSSFGWWGTYLNTNPDKITISPLKKMNTTHHV